jgi:hypothetical protein
MLQNVESTQERWEERVGEPPVPHLSRLDGVIDALIDLDEPEVHRIATRALRSVSDARRSAA